MSLGIFQLIYCIRQTRSIASEVMSLDLVGKRSSRAMAVRTHNVTNEKPTFFFIKCTTLVISCSDGGAGR